MKTAHEVVVEYRSPIDNGHRLKVSILAHGVYIDGFTVRESNRTGEKWWVQPPSLPYKGKYKQVVEFDKKQSLWLEIEQACIDCVEQVVTTADEPDQETMSRQLDEAIERLDEEDPGKGVPWRDYEPE